MLFKRKPELQHQSLPPCPPSDIIKHIKLYNKLFQVSSFPEMSEIFQVSDLQNRKQKHRFDSMDFDIS